jgi:aminopeptidase N
MAGPYKIFECEQPHRIPQRIFCRKSIAKYVEKMLDRWFTVAMRGIEFYEDMFSTPYPFGKLDHIFVADYNMGAMENVGCILYTDSYVERDEKMTNTRR